MALLLASIMSYLSRGWFVCIILLAEKGGEGENGFVAFSLLSSRWVV